jgi:polyisoprenoid-binding protein YceI
MKAKQLINARNLVASLLFSAGIIFAADDWNHYKPQPGSKVTIAGTSTLHDWTVESGIIAGSLELPAGFLADPANNPQPKVETTVPVRSLKSGKKQMDSVMYEAMKMKEHPTVTYRLLELKPSKEAKQGELLFDTKGTLTAAGVTRTNDMVVTFIPSDDQKKLKITGSTNLKMSDFGVKVSPPLLSLGLIKTGDDIKVSFEWLIEQGEPPPAAAAK